MTSSSITAQPDAQLRFWQAELAGAPSPLPLPTCRVRSADRRGNAGRVGFVVGTRSADALGRLAEEAGTRPVIVLQAAFAVLLHQVGCGADVPIATASAGIVTAVLRADLAGNPSFGELVGRLRDRTAAAVQHPVPFDELARHLEPDTPVGCHPLAQVAVETGGSGRAGEPLAGDRSGGVGPDLVVRLDERIGPGRCRAGELTFAPDLFARAGASALARGLVRVLDRVTADPAVLVSRIDVLDPADRNRLLVAGAGSVKVRTRVTVGDLVHCQVLATPDAVAVLDGDRSLTYRELDARANRLARWLAGRGIGTESLVGVALDRSADLVVCLLGILKSGAAYLPIDPAYPGRRLAQLLTDADPALLITEVAVADALPAHDGPLQLLDELDLNTGPESAPDVDRHPDALCYVMYTSGSTGSPKGVGVSHAAVVNGLAGLVDVIGARRGARLLAGTSINFDVSVFEVFTALSIGGVVDVVRDVLALGERRSWTGAVVHTVPSVFAGVLERLGGRLAVDTLVFAGERLPSELVRRVRELVPGAALVNAYGQTESFYATTCTLPADHDPDAGVPIGTPLGNMRAYVLGAGLQPLPPGAAGELYIAGIVARGYRGQPDLTAERFVADPFGPPGERMYRTGDMARWNDDGQLEHLGRSDGQMKLRGVRIEPAEIESALTEHPSVRHAVAGLWRGDGDAEDLLVAYVVPATAATPHARELRRFVRGRLPSAMIPSRFVTLDRLPLTPNGKLDRSALPAVPRRA